MVTGRPRTPSGVKAAQGTDRKDHLPKNEPRPQTVRPTCPAWLDKAAKSCWKELVPQLEGMGVLTKIDRNALTRYCRTWSRWKAAEQSIEKHGSTIEITTQNGPSVKTRPEVYIAASLAAQLARLETEFGMTPSARTRIEATPPEEHGDDKARFFNVVGA